MKPYICIVMVISVHLLDWPVY